MEPTVAELRKNYERLSDDKIIRLATQEAASLRPEALDLLRLIITERGLSDDIQRSIDVQLKEYTEEEIIDYANLLATQPCPLCSSKQLKLNATKINTAKSFIVLCIHEEYIKIACPPCLDKAMQQANITTALLGWWQIPSGPYRTIKALILNNKAKKQHSANSPNDLLIGIALSYIGRLEANRTNPEGIQDIVNDVTVII
jgi:hypothetical protein